MQISSKCSLAKNTLVSHLLSEKFCSFYIVIGNSVQHFFGKNVLNLIMRNRMNGN